MNKDEANKLLDEHKLGIHAHSTIAVTQALWATGDLGHTVHKDVEPPRAVVFSEGFQAVRVGKSKRIGEDPIRVIRWTNH
jgi:hypothetical protein